MASHNIYNSWRFSSASVRRGVVRVCGFSFGCQWDLRRLIRLLDPEGRKWAQKMRGPPPQLLVKFFFANFKTRIKRYESHSHPPDSAMTTIRLRTSQPSSPTHAAQVVVVGLHAPGGPWGSLGWAGAGWFSSQSAPWAKSMSFLPPELRGTHHTATTTTDS